MSTFWKDLRYAARALRLAPGFTAIAVLTLALGVGANTAIFSVVYGVLMRPLGMEDPSRVVFLFQSNEAEGRERTGTSPDRFYDWRQQAGSFDSIAAWVWDSVTLSGEPEAEELGSTLMVSANFFSLLGIEPVLGRAFLEQDEVPGRRGQVTVLSHALWQRRWGGSSEVLGQVIRLDGEPYEIVGVMPPGVALPQADVDLWIPQNFDREDRTLTRRLVPIGRLAPGVALAEAQAEMDSFSQRLAEVSPEFRDWAIDLVPAHEQVVGASRPVLLVAFGAVGMVLLIACANLANLLLARATSREREMATRRALGASRGRILRQVLTESVLLAFLGGAFGVGLAAFGHRLLLAMAPGILPRLADIQLDLPVLGFAAVVSILTGLAFGLAPALHATGVDVNSALTEGSRGSAGSQRHARLRAALVVAQLAVAVTLLTGAGLLLKSLWSLRQVDPGFRPQGVAAGRIYLDEQAYPDNDAEILYYDRLLERLRAHPDVISAGAVTGLPMDPIGIDFTSPYEVAGSAAALDAEDAQRPRADFRKATAGYFEAVGIPLLAGRTFNDRDGFGEPVVIVNQALARQAWPGQDPVGQRMAIYFAGRNEYQVIGVVGDVRFNGPASDYRPEMYLPHPWVPFGSMTVVARTRGEAGGLIPILRSTALEIDPAQPVHSAVTVDQLIAGATASDRFYAALLTCFAAVALLLAGAGIYGVLSYWVHRRTREIGVRMALGADRGDVVALVVRRSVGVTLLGLVLGLAGALAGSRFLTALLYGVGPTDPTVLLLVALVLAAVALAAGYLPARRASRLEPTEALRSE